jgi:hypothetical protein
LLDFLREFEEGGHLVLLISNLKKGKGDLGGEIYVREGRGRALDWGRHVGDGVVLEIRTL